MSSLPGNAPSFWTSSQLPFVEIATVFGGSVATGAGVGVGVVVAGTVGVGRLGAAVVGLGVFGVFGVFGAAGVVATATGCAGRGACAAGVSVGVAAFRGGIV